ncbi:MAG: VacJ family lipoprotein [Boseongicola sp. SB0675_bin_26]|nr:VacJ family lipoprotein [Boseongicola sp. SB0675_bin_26]
MRFRIPHLAIPVVAAAAVSACSVPTEDGAINDPYESLNRVSHAFNKGADRAVIRPLSHAYGDTVPSPVRRSLSHVAAHLDEPKSVANHILQGDVESAGHSFFRFLVNSTVGVAGLFDPAAGGFGLERRQTGFGDTLAAWGVQDGAYVELPFAGPSTERDFVGLVVDVATNPVSHISSDVAILNTASAIPATLNVRYEFSETVDSVLRDSADSYAQLRLYYIQNRQFKLNQQDPDDTGHDPFENLYDEIYEELYDEF